MLTRAALANLIDHTLLAPEATAADVVALVAEAVDLGAYAVCVSSSMVPTAVAALAAGGPVVAAVAGFPSGKHLTEVKAIEAARAAAAGADEIDMVIDVGAALAGDFTAVHDDVAGVRQAVPNVVLKVIVESAALLGLGGEPTLRDACKAADDAGADFVKTSTGFHPSGGASTHAVSLMAAAVGHRVGVKASGGIRTADAACAMVAAGATRLGLSGTRNVLDAL